MEGRLDVDPAGPAEQDPQALVADVIDHPSATRSSASLVGLQVANGRSCSVRVDLATLVISRRSGMVNVLGRPPAYLGERKSKPSALKLWIMSRTRDELAQFLFRVAVHSCLLAVCAVDRSGPVPDPAGPAPTATATGPATRRSIEPVEAPRAALESMPVTIGRRP